MCKIIAIANQKGGQSKSTTAVNLAIGLARHGERVAIVDADPQGSCTASLGYKEPCWIRWQNPTICHGKILNVTHRFPVKYHREKNAGRMPGIDEFEGVLEN